MDKIRLIVSDMDGTLLNEKQELSSDTIKILIQAQQQGIGVVLASGRGLKDLIGYGKQLGIIELVYIVLQSVVKPGITGFFKIDLHIKCYIYLS